MILPLAFFFFLIYLFQILNMYSFHFGCAGTLLLSGFSLVAESGDYSLLQHMGFSLGWLLLLRSTGSRSHGHQ